MKPVIYGVGLIVAIVIVFGTICAWDHEVISLTQSIIQFGISVVIGAFCGYMLYVESERDRKRLVHDDEEE